MPVIEINYIYFILFILVFTVSKKTVLYQHKFFIQCISIDYIKQQSLKYLCTFGMSIVNTELKRLQSKQGIKFKTGFMNQCAKKLMTPQVLLLLRSERNIWKLDHQLYVKHQFHKILEFMTQNKAQVLLINDNSHFTIMKEITNVPFLSLQQLNLSNNQIQSIQCITRFNMPKLSKLDLSQNHLTIIRSLNHLISQLTILKLYDNPIIDIDRLTRSSFHELQELDLELKSKQNVIGQSLTWLIRMPSKSLIQLRCGSRKRIKQNPFYHKLSQRYPRGRISLH